MPLSRLAAVVFRVGDEMRRQHDGVPLQQLDRLGQLPVDEGVGIEVEDGGDPRLLQDVAEQVWLGGAVQLQDAVLEAEARKVRYREPLELDQLERFALGGELPFVPVRQRHEEPRARVMAQERLGDHARVREMVLGNDGAGGQPGGPIHEGRRAGYARKRRCFNRNTR